MTSLTIEQVASFVYLTIVEALRKPTRDLVNVLIIVLPESFWFTMMTLHYYYFAHKYITIERATLCGRLYWFAYMNTVDFDDPIIIENYKTLRLISAGAHISVKTDDIEAALEGGLFTCSNMSRPGSGNTVVLEGTAALRHAP